MLGTCAYNPASPFSIYFSLGEVVGALAFTLAVQQLLKPIYRFRLTARYLTLHRLYACVFAGLAAVVIAASVPNFPILHGGPWGYAIVWEIVAAILFTIAYGAVALAIVQPVRVRSDNLVEFCRSSAQLLSSANEADHLDYIADLSRSLPRLIRAAAFIDHLRNTSAFFDFIYRKQIERGAYASSFLRIVADPAFCESLVKRSPWSVVMMLQELAKDRLHARSAEQFIHELAYQAILRDDGMMAREVGYYGFGTAPMLSDSLFADAFILRTYNPMDWLHSIDSDLLTPQMLKRFNSAAERCFVTLIEQGMIWEAHVAFTIQNKYESIFMGAWKIQDSKDADYRLPFEMHHSVELAIKMADKLLDSIAPQSYEMLFVTDPEKYRSDVLETLVEIVFDGLTAIANRFKGVEDRFWHTAIDTFQKAFPSIGEQPDGMTPFQQRLALKIIEKLNDNMKGFYPAISRVLFACVGPYDHKAGQKNRTAFNILKDAMYFELLQLPDLATNKPDKIRDYFPDNVTFDVSTKNLTHTYFGGEQAVTDLKMLNLSPVSLIANDIRRHQARRAD
jgi:hypothetical protein